jgi:hypothetical protein
MQKIKWILLGIIAFTLSQPIWAQSTPTPKPPTAPTAPPTSPTVSPTPSPTIYIVPQPKLDILADDTEVKNIKVIVGRGKELVQGAVVEIAPDASLPITVVNPNNIVTTDAQGEATVQLKNANKVGSGKVLLTVTKVNKVDIPKPNQSSVSLYINLLATKGAVDATVVITSFIGFLILMSLVSIGVEKITDLIKLICIQKKYPQKMTLDQLLHNDVVKTGANPTNIFELDETKIKNIYAVFNGENPDSPSKLQGDNAKIINEILENPNDIKTPIYNALNDKDKLIEQKKILLQKIKEKIEAGETISTEEITAGEIRTTRKTTHELLIKIETLDNNRRKSAAQWTSFWRIVSLVVAFIIVLSAGESLSSATLLSPVLDAMNIPHAQYQPATLPKFEFFKWETWPKFDVFKCLTAFGVAAGSQFWHDFLDRILALKNSVPQKKP